MTSKGRWRRSKWGSRFVIFYLFLCILIIFFALQTEYTPNLPMEGVARKAILDLLMIFGLFTINPGKIEKVYLLFMIVDAAIGLLAFTFEREKFLN